MLRGEQIYDTFDIAYRYFVRRSKKNRVALVKHVRRSLPKNHLSANRVADKILDIANLIPLAGPRDLLKFQARASVVMRIAEMIDRELQFVTVRKHTKKKGEKRGPISEVPERRLNAFFKRVAGTERTVVSLRHNLGRNLTLFRNHRAFLKHLSQSSLPPSYSSGLLSTMDIALSAGITFKRLLGSLKTELGKTKKFLRSHLDVRGGLLASTKDTLFFLNEFHESSGQTVTLLASLLDEICAAMKVPNTEGFRNRFKKATQRIISIKTTPATEKRAFRRSKRKLLH